MSSEVVEGVERLPPRKRKLRGPRLVVVGGGIAGVCCAQELARLFNGLTVTLVSLGDVLKESSSVMKITNCLEEISVFERRSEFFKIDNPNIHIIDAFLEHIDTTGRLLHLKKSDETLVAVGYDRLCLCTGALPKPLMLSPPCSSPGAGAGSALTSPSCYSHSHPRLLTLRDLETVQTLGLKLSGARRVVVVGNGGIALELVHGLRDVPGLHLVWVVREDYIGHAFFDASASAFIMPELTTRLQAAPQSLDWENMDRNPDDKDDDDEEEEEEDDDENDRQQQEDGSRKRGGGVGPEWMKKSDFIKHLGEERRRRKKKLKKKRAWDEAEHCLFRQEEGEAQGSLQVESGQEIRAIRTVRGGVLGLADGEESCWLAVAGREAGGGALRPKESERAEALLTDHLRASSSSSSSFTQSSALSCAFPLYVLTSRDKIFGCDYVVVAIGATANTSYLNRPHDQATAATNTIQIKKSDEVESGENDERERGGIARGRGGEVLVDEGLQSVSCRGVFAAGDCCQVVFQQHEKEEQQQQRRHWFQMKLWSQARSMGIYAAHCIARSVELGGVGMDLDSVYGNSMLDMFAHITHFFGHKVVLLGRFNAQGLGSRLEGCTREVVITAAGLQAIATTDSKKDSKTPQFLSSPSMRAPVLQNHSGGGTDGMCCGGGCVELKKMKAVGGKAEACAEEGGVEIWTRVTPGVEYVKVTVVNGRVVGALLVGDTGLEEVMENLIMNAMDISAYGVHLLDPELDLEDFFD